MNKNNKNILVAEDDPGIAELMRAVLENSGYKVKVCDNGDAVKKCAEKFPPAFIIMDLWLPGIDGLKLGKILKAGKLTKNIPLIVISAQNQLAEVTKKIRAEGYLAKPFEISDLLALAEKYC